MIVFLHIPKTAGTSFRFILENTFGMRHCHAGHTKTRFFRQPDVDFARRFFPGLQSLAGHNLVDPPQLSIPDPYYITFLREPIGRVISHYQDSVIRGTNRKSFEESLRDDGELSNLHVKLMAGEPNLEKARRFLERCDMVGFTEKFDLSAHILKQSAPYPLNVYYRRRRVAQDNRLKKSIEGDSRLLALAREHNQLDLELYEFALNTVFPRLCSRFGLKAEDKGPSYQLEQGGISWKYYLGRSFNKLYRQVCKYRPKPDPHKEAAAAARFDGIS